MFRTRLEDVSTWELADELHRFRRLELEHRRWRFATKAKRACEAAQILVERHSGLLCEITSRAGLVMGAGAADKEILELYVMRTVFKLRDGTWGNLTRDRFATTLWDCVNAQLSADTVMTAVQKNSVQNLKPKFMLRQFVDEMPDCSEKGLLMAGIFSVPLSLSALSSSEVRRRLPEVCRKLHRTVLGSSGSVSLLTDGAITDRDLLQPDINRRYQRWLVLS
jgi:hypothetical protein